MNFLLEGQQSSRMRLILCIYTLFAFSAIFFSSFNWAQAGPRGVERDFRVSYETRDTEGADISRFLVHTKWQWEIDRRSKLAFEIPFGSTSIEDDATGEDFDLSGVKDASLDYRLNVREARGSRPGLFYSARMNLPTGRATLDDEEQAVVNAINDVSEGFVNAEYGRGFALSLGMGVVLNKGANGSLEISGGYNYRGEFDPSSGITKDDSDIFRLGVKSLREVTPRQKISWGFDALIFTDGELSDDALAGDATIERDPDLIFSYATYQEINPGFKRDLLFAYTLRGERDFVDAGGTNVTPNTDLGDRINLELRFHRRLTPISWLDYGLSYRKTFDSTVEDGSDLDTERDDARVVVGATREVNAGFDLKGDVQFGLTDEARDFVASVGGSWSF